jgi:GLPGLI family protein
MKKYLLIVFSFFYICSFAQNRNGLVIYDVKFAKANGSDFNKSRVFFNDTVSIFRMFSTLFSEDIKGDITQEKDKQGGEGLRVKFKYGDEKGEMIYRNFLKDEIILRFPKTAAFEEFTMKDSWIKIDWKISNDTMTIANFKCRKATGDFRGRHYTVWFTEEIPLPYGPWKLHGLPGIILDAMDSEKMFIAKLKSIQYPLNEAFDTREPVEKNSMTLKEYVYSLDHYSEFLLEKLKSKLPRESANKFTLIPSKEDSDKRKYRTEKVFEWEEK